MAHRPATASASRAPTRARTSGRALLGSLEPLTVYRYRATRAQRTVEWRGDRECSRHPRVSGLDHRRGGRQHAARRRAAVLLSAHGVRPVTLGVPRARESTSTWGAGQHHHGLHRLAPGARGLGDPGAVQGRRGRTRHAGSVGTTRTKPTCTGPRRLCPSIRRGSETRRVTFLTLSGHVYSGSAGVPAGRSVSEVHRPGGHDVRVRPLPAAGLVPARRLRRLRGAARARWLAGPRATYRGSR